VVRAQLRYSTQQGESNVIEAEKTVILENHPKTYWMDLEAPRVLALVSDAYKGNFTAQWAAENDYDAFDKEVFVHAKGYESETEYLLWVNRSHQRLNVFLDNDGTWELIESFIVATGRQGHATKLGVTIISTRTEGGWEFGSYTVKPVIRFWPGLAMAFHSRPLHPRTDAVTDARIGFPVSQGCVRMFNEDVNYIYDNIPTRTTVVVH